MCFVDQGRDQTSDQRFPRSLLVEAQDSSWLALDKDHTLDWTDIITGRALSVNCFLSSFIRALLDEPKDVNSSLRREPDTHWNLILPQIICYIVVLKVLKLPIESSPAYLILNFALSLALARIYCLLLESVASLMAHVSVTRLH